MCSGRVSSSCSNEAEINQKEKQDKYIVIHSNMPCARYTPTFSDWGVSYVSVSLCQLQHYKNSSLTVDLIQKRYHHLFFIISNVFSPCYSRKKVSSSLLLHQVTCSHHVIAEKRYHHLFFIISNVFSPCYGRKKLTWR